MSVLIIILTIILVIPMVFVQGRRSAGAPEITSKKKKTGDVPWFFEQYAGEGM